MAQKTAHLFACQVGTSKSVKQHKLRKIIASLSSIEGRGKELISLYVPLGSSLDQLIMTIKKDAETLSKESDNGVNCQNALKNVIQHLKQRKEIPENGLALFAAPSINNGVESLGIEEIIPLEPITAYDFSIDDHFHLELLRKMLRDQKVVGILVLDSKQASFGILRGEHLELMENISSGVSGKTGKGGQSQRRYERERDMGLGYFYRRIAEHATKSFLENNVNVLIAGGPGLTKGDFLNGNYLHYELQNMLLNIVDTHSASQEAVREVLDKSLDILNNMCGPEERRIVQRLMNELSKQDGLATYGLDSVLRSLRSGQVQVALVTDNTGMVETVAVCKSCGHQKPPTINRKTQTMLEKVFSPCEKCGKVSFEIIEKDIVDVLEDLASQVDSSVEVISSDSKEKEQLNALGGFAALLRYKP